MRNDDCSPKYRSVMKADPLLCILKIHCNGLGGETIREEDFETKQ
jgi:hypothetical protein